MCFSLRLVEQRPVGLIVQSGIAEVMVFFSSGFNFTTGLVVSRTVGISHVFIGFSEFQLNPRSFTIHLYLSVFVGSETFSS